jgi:plastocyanin
MLRRGTAGRRIGLAAALAAIGVMIGAGLALAASDTIVAGVDTYSKPTYNADQGSVVPFQDPAGAHNVTARQSGPDGKPLFRSPTINGGTASVDGTQYLAAGDYAFFCTIHPTTMTGTLHVTANGIPQARPSATLTSKTKTISKALKKGIKVSADASTAISGVAFTAKLGKAIIGKTTASLAAGVQTVTVKLNKAGKSKLRSKRKASVSVTANIPFGSPATAKAKLK